ncbi:MAG: response regulator [Archangium sp.]|nr:response regulator [Archangium sp.]
MARVLLVDDDLNVLRGHGRILRNGGYQVETANSGEHALELVAAGDFDAVILDVRMPGMDGITFLRLLRERACEVPVMLLTGSLTAENAATAINLGVAGCLVKPINARELTDGLTHVVRPRVLH